MNSNSDTIVAPITPVVIAPVILLRVSGIDAIKTFTLIKDKKGNVISNPEPNRAYFASFTSTKDNLSDDVIITYFKSPRSFTGDDTVEISFHGSPIIIGSALSSLYALGFRQATNGEFSKRAFLNGKLDLSEAEAIQELISAKSEATLAYAYKQMNGAVAEFFHNIKDSLLDIKAVIEAKIDFPDEDTVDDIYPIISKQVDTIYPEIEKVLKLYQSLRKHNHDVTIAIIGKPNVGKSSLLNKLINKDRAIVSDTPGTTRDYILEDAVIGTTPISIIDTAGIRISDDELEMRGIEKTLEQVSLADLILLLIDVSSDIDDYDRYILDLTKPYNRIIVANKSDKKTAADIDYDILISAKTGDSIDKLKSIIEMRLADDKDITIDGVVTVSERHAFILSKIIDRLDYIRDNLSILAVDMLVFELQDIIGYLEEITGERYTEDVLSIIFNKFCIGK